MTKPTIAIMTHTIVTQQLLSAAALAQLKQIGAVVINPDPGPPSIARAKELIQDSRACIISRGCPPLTAEILDAAPDLGLITYGAGSVKGVVTDDLWARDIILTSAAAAIAVNVSEMTLGCIILGLKNMWTLSQRTRAGDWRPNAPAARAAWERSVSLPIRELYGATIGVVGASQVGRRVIELLGNFDVAEILVYDPFWSEEQLKAIGATKAPLDDLLSRSDVVTLHAPGLPETYHMVNAEKLQLMKDEAILINFSRGVNIDQAALIAELQQGRFFAFLDVTDPEPPAEDSILRTLPNVILTPHMAGGAHTSQSRNRLGDLMVQEISRYFAGEPPLYPITKERLATIG